jgi:hypothetical protein
VVAWAAVVVGLDAVVVWAAVVVGLDAVVVWAAVVVGLDAVVVWAAVVVGLEAVVVVWAAVVVGLDAVVVWAAVVVGTAVVGAAVVNGARPITKLLPTHAPDPDTGSGASRRYCHSGSAIAPAIHVNSLPGVVKDTVQFQYSNSPVDSSTVIGTMLPTVMALGGRPAMFPEASAVKFLATPPTVMLALMIEGLFSIETPENHQAVKPLLGFMIRTLQGINGGRVSVTWWAEAAPSMTPRHGSVVRCVVPPTNVSRTEYTLPSERAGRPPDGKHTTTTSLALKLNGHAEPNATAVAVPWLYTSITALMT